VALTPRRKAWPILFLAQNQFQIDLEKSTPLAKDRLKDNYYKFDVSGRESARKLVAAKEKQDKVKKANQRVYIYNKTGKRCLYAANVLKNQNAVNCDFGDTGQGVHMPAMVGSPLYAQTFAGVGLDGLYAYPLGFYADNNTSRNLFHGLFSLVGDLEQTTSIIKTAVCNLNQTIWDKLENDDILTPEEQDQLNEALRNCRNEFEDNTQDTAKINELGNKYNPNRGR